MENPIHCLVAKVKADQDSACDREAHEIALQVLFRRPVPREISASPSHTSGELQPSCIQATSTDGGARMDENRSTTPPVSPPGSSETLQTQHPEPPDPSSAQAEVIDTDMDIDGNSNGNGPQSQPELLPQSKLPRLARGKTPEPNRVIQISHSNNIKTSTNGHVNGHSHAAAVAHAPHLAREQSGPPGSPGGHLSSFDWDDLETRFEKALASANESEQALMDEFQDLVKYFNVWASTAASHDNERAAKRYGAASRWWSAQTGGPFTDQILGCKLEHTLSSSRRPILPPRGKVVSSRSFLMASPMSCY